MPDRLDLFLERHRRRLAGAGPLELAELLWLGALAKGEAMKWRDTDESAGEPPPQQPRPLPPALLPEPQASAQSAVSAGASRRGERTAPASEQGERLSGALELPRPLQPRLRWARALSRLGRRLPTGPIRVDVGATVQEIAQAGGEPVLVLRRRMEPATSLIFLVDTAGGLAPWRDDIEQLVRLAQQSGRFSRVQRVDLDLTQPPTLPALHEAGRSTLAILISDGLSPAVGSGALGAALREGARGARVLWVQPWGRRRWWRIPTIAASPGARPTPISRRSPVRVGLVGWSGAELELAEPWLFGRSMGHLQGLLLPAEPIPRRDSPARSWQARWRELSRTLEEPTLQLLALAAGIPGRISLELFIRAGEELTTLPVQRYHIAEALTSGLLRRVRGPGLVVEFLEDDQEPPPARAAARERLSAARAHELLGFLARQLRADPGLAGQLGLPYTLIRHFAGDELLEDASQESLGSVQRWALQAMVSQLWLPVSDEVRGLLREAPVHVAAPAADHDAPVGGRFRLQEAIDRGPSASLWRAVDVHSEQPVLLKLLDADKGRQAHTRERFFQAMQARAAAHHPGLLRVLDPRWSGGGRHGAVLEAPRGTSLTARLERVPLAPASGMSLMLEVAEALAVLHRAGLLHRAISPDLIFIDRRACLVDAALVSGLDGPGPPLRFLQAPELARAGRDATPATDVYSLAASIARAIAQVSRRALDADLSTLISRLKLPIGWEKVLARASHRTAASRYPDAAELLEALEPVASRRWPKLIPLPRGELAFAETPVTQAQWLALMDSNPAQLSRDEPRAPVESVSWFEAIDYCNRLSEVEGLRPHYETVGEEVVRDVTSSGYRLPTETEWEWACRAGNTSRFWSGEPPEALLEVAWVRGNSQGATKPVRQKPPNPYGLYDMHGNVFEWCWDLRFDRKNPERAARGGAWSEQPEQCEVGYRGGAVPDRRDPRLGLRPVRTLRPRRTLIELAEVPGGVHWIGSPAGEVGRWKNEGPRHQVRLSGFHMATVPVTQEQWLLVMGENPSHHRGDLRRPVEQVSWLDAVRFCNALSEREGRTPAYQLDGETVRWDREASGYRLPTESEWESACRGGTSSPYSSGADEGSLSEAGWYLGNAGVRTERGLTYYDADGSLNREKWQELYAELKPTTHPVGQKAANPLGLYDLHGNVWEWCWDWYDDKEYDNRQPDKETIVTNPNGPKNGDRRVLRGGSFANEPGILRSAYRVWNLPSDLNWSIGFRCVLPSLRQLDP